VPAPLTLGLLFWQQLQHDFSDSVARQEMKWEFADGIWSEHLGLLHSENIRTLARRYALACSGKGYANTLMEFAKTAQTDDNLLQIRRLYYQSRQAFKYLKIIQNTEFDLLLANSSTISTLRSKFPNLFAEAQPDFPSQLADLQRQRDQILGAFAEGKEDRLELSELKVLAGKLEALRWYAIRARVGVEELVFVQRHRTRGHNWYGDLSFFMKSPRSRCTVKEAVNYAV